MAEAAIVDYQTGWSDEFCAVGEVLRREMAGIALRIDHVGNTAVPGLIAKDIIDLQVSVTSLDDVVGKNSWFAATDLVLEDEPVPDPVPVGADDGGRSWTRRIAIEHPGERQIHVHIRESGSPNERYALVFRDYLRSIPAAAKSYGRIMATLRDMSRDGIDRYKAIKVPACDLVVQSAVRWAEMVDWKMASSDL